jgi:hypothetical protein
MCPLLSSVVVHLFSLKYNLSSKKSHSKMQPPLPQWNPQGSVAHSLRTLKIIPHEVQINPGESHLDFVLLSPRNSPSHS